MSPSDAQAQARRSILGTGAVLVVLLLGCSGYLYWEKRPRSIAPPRTVQLTAGFQPERLDPPAPRASVSPAPLSVSASLRKKLAGSPLAGELNAPAGDGQRDVETLHKILHQYLRLLGRRQGLPIGNDHDLARVLTGHNPMQMVLLPSDHPALRRDGRLCDRWGAPYFIHPRGGGAYEIRSAGPNGHLFDQDDLVANGGAAAAGEE